MRSIDYLSNPGLLWETFLVRREAPELELALALALVSAVVEVVAQTPLMCWAMFRSISSLRQAFLVQICAQQSLQRSLLGV